MNFDKEGSKFEKKNVCVCVCGGEGGGGGRCTDTKSVCKTILFFFILFFFIFFFNFF